MNALNEQIYHASQCEVNLWQPVFKIILVLNTV